MMGIKLYPLREWGWVWIAMGTLWIAGALIEGPVWPPPTITTVGIIVILFGILVAPGYSRKDQ
jgi:hypothetical protein